VRIYLYFLKFIFLKFHYINISNKMCKNLIIIIIVIVLCALLYAHYKYHSQKQTKERDEPYNNSSGDSYADFDPRPIYMRLPPYSGAMSLYYPDYYSYSLYPWGYPPYFPVY
jgi:hypothetical protein